MPKSPVGSIVSIYYDSPRQIEIGQFLMTPTGRAYQIVELRRQTKGKHIGRWHIKGLVTLTIPAGSTTHPIYWYLRKSRKR